MTHKPRKFHHVKGTRPNFCNALRHAMLQDHFVLEKSNGEWICQLNGKRRYRGSKPTEAIVKALYGCGIYRRS